MFLNENQGVRYFYPEISFIYNGKTIKLESNNSKNLFCKIIDWLYDNGYRSKEAPQYLKMLSYEEKQNLIKNKNYEERWFHKIHNSNLYILKNSGVEQLFLGIEKLFNQFNIDPKTIKYKNLNIDNKILKSFEFNEMNNKTYITAAVEYMKTAITPLTTKEIWKGIRNKIKKDNEKPEATLDVILKDYSDNYEIPSRKKKEKPYFTIVEKNPAKFWLIERLPELNKQESENKVLKPSEFDSTIIQNPFGGKDPKTPGSNSLCVVGGTGVGKSLRIIETLKSLGHKTAFIKPTFVSDSLLFYYNPKDSDILPNKLSRIIIEAANNPQNYYTVVFDECQNYIMEIRREVIHCLSRNRYGGERFIETDEYTDKYFKDLELKDERRLITDNLGFVLITSKPATILNNPDIKARIDIIPLEKADQDAPFALDFIEKRIEMSKSKYSQNEEDIS